MRFVIGSARICRNVWGKLCFGFEENCQFVQAEAAGDKALEYTPRDIWAIHSMSHVHEETGKLVLYNSIMLALLILSFLIIFS